MLKDHKVDAIMGKSNDEQLRGREVCKLNYSFLLSCCSSKEAEQDYSISAPLAPELPPAAGSAGKKTRTVGIVEPRVVVKIPWTKIGRKTLPQENYSTKQMQPPTQVAPDATNVIKVYQSDEVSNPRQCM